MSLAYCNYLDQHIANVGRGLQWFIENRPDILRDLGLSVDDVHICYHNPHHWQYWVLIHDEPNEPTEALAMPSIYILEMVCDWWAFSWAKGDLTEIFKWYDEHKNNMILHTETRKKIDILLDAIRKYADEREVEE
jgi:hypothetical protein